MDFSLNDEQKMMIDTLRRFIAEELHPLEDELDEQGFLAKEKALDLALKALKTGEKNKTEQRYEDEVLRPHMIVGKVLWYRFEGIKLRLADNTFLTIDYAVLPDNGVLTLVDVKGGQAVIQDDARVKWKVVKEKFWMFEFVEVTA